jgi:hypothetical protein
MISKAAIYGPDPINFAGVNGDRYWVYKPFDFSDRSDVNHRLSGFPVSIFLPQHRHPHNTPLVIGLQGMAAPYGWNAFIVPILTEMGIAVALFDSPLAGERSLVRSFTAEIDKEVRSLLDAGVSFDTQFLANSFKCIARDLNLVKELCIDRYNLTDRRLALFGVSMGVLQSAFAFTAHGIGERLLGTIGHADLQFFAKSWSKLLLPELADSWLGGVVEKILTRVQPNILPAISILRTVKNLKDPDLFGRECNPMNYADRVKLPRRVRFLVGEADPLLSVADARACAARFPDGDCFVVPGLAHGKTLNGITFVEHVRYFLSTQLSDWHC